MSADAGERTAEAGESPVCALAGSSRRGPGRDSNQDRWAALSHSGGALLVVADGMGGTTGGAAAATAAVAAVLEVLVRAAPDPLAYAFSAADHAVRQVGVGTEPAWSRAGCTLTAALITGGWADIAHVGDSSCWLVRAGALRLLTEVHTTAATLAANGAIRSADRDAQRLDHLLTRYLGMPGGAEVQRHRLRLRPGDRVLVATDGLTRSLDSVALRGLLVSQAPPEELVAAAVTAGARDDITAVMATVGRP